MKYADLPKGRIDNVVKPEDATLEKWQVMLRMQQANREDMKVECVNELYNPGEYRVTSAVSGSVYKVVYRGPKSPWNYCDCMDFKTSQLGTCKHIEHARLWIAEHHKRIHRELPAYTSVYLSYRGSERRVKIRVGSDHEQEFKALANRYFDGLDTLKPESYELFGTFLSEAKCIDLSFCCYRDALEFVLEQRERERRRRIIMEKYDDTTLDHLLKYPLYPFQREGVRFAVCAGRSILADEMGLGKTIQAIATAELLRRECLVAQTLVLCPTTLKYQWRREIERFTDATVTVVEGQPEQRHQLMQSDAAYKIVSYNSFAQEIKDFGALEADFVVMDEVQRLKNWNTQIARSVRRLTSRYALMLTGTPLENRLEELYSVVELVDQFLLSPFYLFKDRYMQLDETGRVIGYRNLNEIGERIAGVLLRRRKRDVALQLPERVDKQLFVPMTAKQSEAHQTLRRQAARLVAKWHRMHYLSELDRRALLQTLAQMRMVCDSLALLEGKSRSDTKVDEVLNIVEECGETTKVVIFSRGTYDGSHRTGVDRCRCGVCLDSREYPSQGTCRAYRLFRDGR